MDIPDFLRDAVIDWWTDGYDSLEIVALLAELHGMDYIDAARTVLVVLVDGTLFDLMH
jgi:hypothetical protein